MAWESTSADAPRHASWRCSGNARPLVRQAAQNRGRAPVGAHSTAHTTRTTHVSAHLCIRGSWRGRARAWTHLGTRAAGAGRWTALLGTAPPDPAAGSASPDESSAAVPRSSQKKWISGCCFWLILERRRRDFRAGSGGCGLKPALPGLTVAASGSWVADLARKTGGRLEGVRSIEGGVRSIDFGANPKID